MPDNIYSGITGTDGETPIYDPDGRFQVWNRTEIYTGGIGDKKFVPKINDLVVDLDQGLWYKVVGLDVATLVPQLQEWQSINSGGDLTEDDLLLGVGPGTTSDTYRVYLNQSVIPHTLTVDGRLFIRGSMATHARIFHGNDQADIISHIYDPQGNIIADKVALELADLNNTTNVSTKIVPTCYTMKEIPDGDIVTLYAYSADGHILSKRQLLIENTQFLRASTAATKYITGISLECPFLSQADPQVINLPINVTLAGLNMIGVVHYSDGSEARLPVDGTKFTLLGLQNYIATVVDQQVPVVLRYQLSSDEYAVNAQQGEFPFVAENYKVRTMQADGAYSVKLYGYPVWQDSASGYSLRWHLYNADRTVVYDVTSYLEFAANSPAFNPTQYGVNQQLVVAVNLNNVNGSYRNYRHVQTVAITLWGPGTNRTTNWTIAFSPGQTPPFGENNFAKLEVVNSNLFRLNLASGATTKAEWLARLYTRTLPLIDQTRELAPPEPTHFRLRFGAHDQEYTIDNWNVEQTVSAGLAFNKTVFIEFIRRTPNTDLQLAVAGLPIYEGP